MYAFGVPFIHRDMVGERIAHGNKVEGDEAVGQIENLLYRRHAVFMRIQACPYSSQSYGVRRQQQILGCG